MKKIISSVLGIILVSNMAVSFAKVGEYEYTSDKEKEYIENILDADLRDESYTTDLFEGDRMYLLEDVFFSSSNGQLDSDTMPAGWDVDRRGGLLRSDGTRVCLMDGDPNNVVSMYHELMPHKNGDLVLETAFIMKNAKHDGFYYQLTGGGKTAVRLETHDGKICYLNNGSLVPITEYSADKNIPMKVTVHMDTKTMDIIVDGVEKKQVPLSGNADRIDGVELSTSVEGDMTVGIEFVHVYINYIVNERFLMANPGETPVGWTLNDERMRGAGVQELESQTVDIKSYKLETLSILERPSITKEFECNADKMTVEFYTLIPDTQDGSGMQLYAGDKQALSITTENGNFVLNGSEVIYDNYVTNLWYRFIIDFDLRNHTADIKLNYITIAENIPYSGTLNKIRFLSGAAKGSAFWVDDVLVYEKVPTPAGYPSKPRVVEPKDDLSVGMVMYSMWREGLHFGWDRMSPYEERMPYLGYYTEAIAETADWETKWLYEHGVNFQIFPFCSLDRTEPTPIKKPIRTHALLDGLLVAEYPMDFCIMWSNAAEETIHGLDDFKNNILPYWKETFFRHPYYKTIDNKLLVYTYQTKSIISLLGGEDNFREALRLIDETGKELGYDGAIVVSNQTLTYEEAAKFGMLHYRYGWAQAADDGEAVIKETKLAMESSEITNYIPSITQGYNNTPWRINSVGFMTPEESNAMLKFVGDNTVRWREMGNVGAGIVTLTCWNEWGEGHFYSPSKLEGFAYMNAVRNHLTNSGELKDEDFPTKQSYLRMNVLYPNGRQALKLMPDQVSADNLDNLVLLERIDFTKPENFSRLQIGKNAENMRIEDGMIAVTATENDPTIHVNDVNLDAQKVKIIKMDAWQERGASYIIYYQTTVDPDIGVNGKRFSSGFSSDDVTQLIMLPADESKLKGTITGLRIDPDDKVMGEFKFNNLEIWGTESKNISLYIDGEEYINNTPIRMQDGTTFMSIYKYFYATKKTKTIWYKKEGRFRLEYKDYVIDMYDGKTEYAVNGQKKQFTNAPYYDDGNFFVPVREFFEGIGFGVEWDNDNYAISLNSPAYRAVLARGETPEAQWNFDINDYADGWTMSNSFKRVIVSDGILSLGLRNNPSTMTLTGLNIDTSKYQYAVIRLKNNSDADKGRFFFTNETITSFSSNAGYIFDLSHNDSKYTDYVIDLTSNTNYSGTIKSLRFDLTGKEGTVYIDSIILK